MNTFTINGTYGSQETPCTIFIAENRDGSKWYCVEDSINVNLTFDDLAEGVDVELVSDHDCFTWSSNIEDVDQLVNAIES